MQSISGLQSDPHSACTQTVETAMQVEVEIDTMDRGGNFLGTLKILGGSRPFNLGPALLEAGLAKLHPSFDPNRVQGGQELASAQEHAQKGKVKVCMLCETASLADSRCGILHQCRFQGT